MKKDDDYGSVTIFHDARSPEHVFQDFCRRCAGIIKALTTDVGKLYKLKLCDHAYTHSHIYFDPKMDARIAEMDPMDDNEDGFTELVWQDMLIDNFYENDVILLCA
ncbi:hypothetical protein OsI_36071 [Oryza sativa Indica Group]|uniref:Alfin N-terminal domain-containing protein n=1 Tax=Oryza sativa subsp. indica TaxID=39946 RepID=B8BKF8_ORYSI|nr:hypothetical protein OsI_36071 [Oryza sativa Indica Group]